MRSDDGDRAGASLFPILPSPPPPPDFRHVVRRRRLDPATGAVAEARRPSEPLVDETEGRTAAGEQAALAADLEVAVVAVAAEVSGDGVPRFDWRDVRVRLELGRDGVDGQRHQVK